MAVLGLDIGSSGAKGLVLNDDGAIAAVSRVSYLPRHGDGGTVELDASLLADRVAGLIEDAVAQSPSPIDAVAITSVGEAIVPVDQDGTPLAPAMLTADTRLSGECRVWDEADAALDFVDTTGLPLRDMWSVHAMRVHLRNTGISGRITGFCTLEEIVHRALGVEPATALSQAARSGLLDRRKLAWSDSQAGVAGVDPSLLSRIALPGTEVGQLSTSRFGLPRGARVVSGGHDQYLASVGAGAGEHFPMWSSGTVESLTVVTPKASLREGVPTYPVDEDVWVSPVPNLNGGQVLFWLCGLLGRDDPGELLDAGPADDRDDTIFVPTLGTTGAPDFDTAASGLIAGLTYRTDAGQLARAAVRGITHETRHAASLLGRGVDFLDGFALAGGGSRSVYWNRMRAAAFGLPVTCRKHHDCAAIGAALMAFRALGADGVDLDRVNPVKEVIDPDAGDVAAFEKAHARYLELRARTMAARCGSDIE
ncbi:sugar (pentulose or hexulose) kinase [Aliiruegeria haliotis]|uniref:Sugar (Pentulose or hexulose) kinase n=1 Tax=Aliiruegeria haliotis TaxID=1280846 RepID=A0A2T0RIE2_9RHOB|nr:FGGY family carbohydrate kinase [Aliiruegeria haliotis]PRY20974.1 sugar (pentulose or hexulose) kinase [Aliiruegeria haliotis]